jgi:hypothetical protein
VYLALAVIQFVKQRHLLARTVRDGLATPFDQLEEADEQAAARDRPGDRPAGDRESA